MAFPTNDTGASSQSMLDYMDKVRDQRAGAALSLQQPEEQQVRSNITAASADRQMSPGEMQAAMVARTLAETLIRSTFLLLHETLRTQFPEQMMLNRGGEWIPVSPQQWPKRTRVNVKVGLSPAERNRKANALATTVTQQMALFEKGGNGIVMNLNGLHRALLDWSKAVDLDNAEKYWVDPESEGSQQAAAQQAEQAEQQRLQQLQAFTAEAQANAINSERDFMVDLQKIQFDYFKAILESEQNDASNVIELAKQAQSARDQGSADNPGNGAGVG